MAQFNVNLAFNADTGKAKTQIQELQSLLSKIAYTGTTSGTNKLQTDLHAASEAAKELQLHLNNAFNASTGNFDLSMLDRSLKTSGSNITDLSMKLLNAGTTGQQAFVKLAQSISLADQPMFRISKRMQEFAVTMKNTVKWQLSSSMLHGFMGAVQSAYGYAQDLNKSLNDIRIVTGYNTDRMAEFAEQANKAAKALSTTTTDYTNASLIYFQQGLSDEEVTARTDITVKMANAVGQSAEVISEQLTAVWNNFNDGSKSLEYYADVMTALGAATASSSDEISEGLSKFAAVAGSVGLSYEYATSALATLTSNTRESADVVGNSLKTLFARIQGLQLGETLDDGTDLNKYSQALEKVGISIYDANGGLKDMDNILDEMAAKWNTLSDTQQVALAQTVAGVRQYNQLIALMENWNNGDGDSMIANLNTVSNSRGALQEQADIYAQSWEAASKRVQAAAEGIYQSLIDDKFFIDLNNGFANLLGGLDAFIEGAGGIKTILIGIGGIIASTFANKIPEALDTFKYNLEIMTKGTQVAYDRIQQKMQEANQIAFTGKDKNGIQVINNPIDENSSMGEAIKQANALTAARNKLALVSDRMSNAEKQAANQSLNFIHSQQEELVALKEKAEVLEKNIKLQKESLRNTKTDRASMIASQKSAKEISDLVLEYKDTRDSLQEKLEKLQAIPEEERTDRQSDRLTQIAAELEQYKLLYNEMEKFSNYYNTIVDKTVSDWNVKTSKTLLERFLGDDFDEKKKIPIEFSEEVKKAFKDVRETMDSGLDFDDSLNLDGIKNKLKAISSTIAEPIREATGLEEAFQKVFRAKNSKELEDSFKDLANMIDKCGLEGSELAKTLEKIYGKPIINLVSDMKELKNVTDDVNSKASLLSKLLNDFKPTHTVRLSEAFGSLAGMIGNTVTIANSLVSVFKAMANPDLSGWERLSVVFSSIATIIPTALSSISDFSTLTTFMDQAKKKAAELTTTMTNYGRVHSIVNNGIANYARAEQLKISSLSKEEKALINSAIASHIKGEADEKATKAALADVLMKKQIPSTEAKAAAAEMYSTIVKEGHTKVTWKLVAAQMGLNAAMLPYIAIIAAVVASIGAAVLIYDALTTSQKEAQEAIQEAADAVEEEKSKLQDLKSELSSVKDKIEELTSKGPLTLTEQGELNRLRAIESSLENQISSQQRLLEIEQQRQALAITQNWGAAYGHLENAKTEGSTEYVAKTYEDTDVGGIKIPGWLLWLGDTMTNVQNAQNGNYQVGTTTDATMEQKTFTAEENANNWYAQHGAEFIQAESDYFTLMQAYTSGILDDATRTQIEAAMEEMQAGLRAGRLASVGGDVDAYNDRYLAGVAGSSSFSGLTATDIANKNFNYAAMAGNDALAIAGVDATEFNEYMSTQMAKAMQMGFSKEELAGLEPEQLQTFLINLDDLNKEAIDKFRMLGISLGEWIDGTVEGVYQSFNTAKWQNEYQTLMKVIDDLETGDTISAEDYAVLGEEYAQYFQVQADGTAMLIAKAEDLKSAIDNISLESLKREIGSQQSRLDQTEDIFNQSNNSKMSLDAITSKAEQGLLSTEQQTQYIQAVTEAFGGQYESAEAAAAAIRSYQASLNENQNILASTADNIDELNEMMKQGAIDAEEYYNNVDGTILKEASKEGFDTEELLEYAETLESVIEDQENAESISKRLALQNQKLQKGIDSLGDNWEDWNKALKTGNKNSKNYIEALTGIKDAMSNMLDIDISLLSEEFITSSETAKLLEKAVKGDLDAIDQLRIAAAKDIVQKVTVDLDETSQEKVLASIMELANTDVTIGASLDSTGFTDALNEMILNSQMTIDDIMNILNALGWEPEIDYKEIPVSEATQSQIAQEVEIYNPLSGEWETATVHSISNADQDAKVRIPIIKGSSTTYGGSAKTAATPPTPKSSGGGGSKTKKETKQRDDEVERYHVVKEQMEELEKQAEKLSKAKDQAFGKGKLDLIEKEIELLDEQIKKQDEYLKQIQKYGEEDKALMIVYGAQFDENGVITNYEQLMDQELAKYNKAVEQYNKNHDEKKFAAAEARYEKFLNDMEQYEETMDEWDEAQAARADMLREIYDLKFEALTYEIEVDIDLEEDDLKLLDYYLEKLDDDAFSAAESITLLGKKTQDLLDQSKIYSDGIMDLLSLHGLSDERINQYMNGSLTEQELITMGFSDEDIATLREYRDNLLEINKDLSSIREEIYSKIIEAFDAWNEKITDNIDKIEKLNKVLNSYQNIIDIVGVNTLKIDDKFMKNLSNAIVDNSKKVLDASVKKYHSLQEAQLQAQQEYEKSLIEGNEETIRYWEETLEHINNEVQNAEQEMMDSWQDALQAAADAFNKSVENIMNNFEKALSGSFGNLDNLSEMFEQRTEIADRYLDDYEKIYQLSKLNRDINNSIDDTDSIKAKKILKSLQEEINELQNSEQEMSQYDLEYLQKRYELKLAEIALEEAQNAKSTVRMMQDSEGNWSYVYTSDQEEISNAQQQYEDALFNMQVANEDYIQDLQEKALDAQKAMTEAIKSIDKTQFATEDAYKERIDQIREYYMDQQNYYYDEMAKALSNNKELYENDWLNYSNLTNYKISSDKEYVDNFAETTYAQIMGYNSIEEAQNNFIIATDIMVQEIIESYTLWLSNINEIMDLAGTSIDTFASDTENNLDRINKKTNEVADSIDDLSQDIVDDFDYIIDAVSDWEDNYVDAIDTTIQANEDMYDSCNNLIGMLNNVDISISNTGKNFSSTAQQIAKAAADIAAAAQRAAAAAQNIASSGGSISSGSTSTSSTSQQNKSITITLYSTKYLQGKMGIMKVTSNTPISVSNQLQAGGASYYASGPGWQGYISTEDRLKLRQTFPERFDTGGYTGAWGTSGKLAVLHEKELVLNAEDTQNMLNAINIVREITKAIDLNAGIQSLGLQLQNLSNLASGINNSDIQQIVQITAEFPDAVYHSEIEEAFKTLLNESSQYISREK